MGLTQQTFDELRELAADQYVSVASVPARVDEGSTMGALINAIVMLAVQIEQQIAYEDTISRLGTTPANADGSPAQEALSFAAPWGIAPIGATYASGQVTFATSSPAITQIVIPSGVIVQTGTGASGTGIAGIAFSVVADPTNMAYDATLGGYPIDAGQSTVTATVRCNVAGLLGNVQSGLITQLFSGPGFPPFPAGISTVTNAAAFTNATATESDADFKARFQLTVTGQRSGVPASIAGAIRSVEPGLTYSIGDGLDATGSARSAYFTVVVNLANQSAAPPGSLLSAVSTAIEGSPSLGILGVRPAGISYTVIAPTLVPISVTSTLTGSASAKAAAVVAVAAYLNGIGLDPAGAATMASVGRIYAIIFGVPGIVNVDAVHLGGGTSDITAGFAHQIVAGSITFT